MSIPVSVEPNVASTRSGAIATLTIGDGRHLNALGIRDWQEIERLARLLGADPSVSCVVVRGCGYAFCSGSDLGEWAESSTQAVTQSFLQMERAFRALEAIPVPTVAYVEKVAAGAGCQLALACDLQVLSASSRIGMPILRLGILTPVSFARRLTSRIGASRTKALLFGGALLSAGEAHRIGLVTHAPSEGSAQSDLEALLLTWSSMPVSALRAAKASVNEAVGLSAGVVRPAQPDVFVTADFGRRVKGFLEGSR